LGLTHQGGPLEPGARANVVVFDPDAAWSIDPGMFHSRSRNTPFAGRRVHGRVVAVFHDGRQTVLRGRVLSEVSV
jgi:dihydroorotase